MMLKLRKIRFETGGIEASSNAQSVRHDELISWDKIINALTQKNESTRETNNRKRRRNLETKKALDHADLYSRCQSIEIHGIN